MQDLSQAQLLLLNALLHLLEVFAVFGLELVLSKHFFG